MSVNSVVLSGRVGRTPELRSTNSGKSVCVFSIAVDEGFGENKSTSWWNIEAWNKTGEAVARLVDKGCRVVVNGRLRQESWDDHGTKKTAIKIVASEVEVVDFKENQQGGF